MGAMYRINAAANQMRTPKLLDPFHLIHAMTPNALSRCNAEPSPAVVIANCKKGGARQFRVRYMVQVRLKYLMGAVRDVV